MRKALLFGGWIVVVVLTTALTWQIVDAADAQVSDRPASPLNVAAPVFDPTIPPSTTPTTTTLPATATTVTVPESTTTTSPSTSTTSGSAPTTTAPATTTTTTGWSLKTVTTKGGTVVLRYRPGEVAVQATTPAPGFRGEIEEGGPPEIEVEFESDKLKVEVHAKWDGGDVNVEVSESAED